MDSKIRVLVADDQAIVAEGLCALLALDDEIEIVDRAENGLKVLEILEKRAVDLILMDIRMPQMNGVDCTAQVINKYPQTKVLILTTFDDDQYIVDALRNGASGYMLKDLTRQKLVTAIKDVHRGNAVMDHNVSRKILSGIGTRENRNIPIRTEDGEILTSREMDVLKLVARGKTNDEIAEELFLSTGTVKNYVTNLYDKLNIKGRTKLMSFGIDSGMA